MVSIPWGPCQHRHLPVEMNVVLPSQVPVPPLPEAWAQAEAPSRRAEVPILFNPVVPKIIQQVRTQQPRLGMIAVAPMTAMQPFSVM